MKKRFLPLALAFVMVLALLPSAALAIDVTNYPNHQPLSTLMDDPEPTITDPRTDDVALFTRELIAGLTTDLEKARAIFDWVSQNIEYDHIAAAYIKKDNRTEEEDRRVSEACRADTTFANRRGVCDGYSSLYVSMCLTAGLPVAKITGWVRQDRHAWNAVFADGRWIFLDPQDWWDMPPDRHDWTTTVDCYSGIFRFSSGGLWNVTCDREEVVIPDHITEITQYAFRSCPSLTRLTIPNSVTKIGNYAFATLGGDGFPNLAHLTIPDSVTEIGDNAFYGCIGLTSITIPASVTIIGSNAFYSCKNLTSVVFLDGTKTIVSRLGNQMSQKALTMFSRCSNLTTLTIPAGVRLDPVDFFECPLTDVYYGGTEEQWKEEYTYRPLIPGPPSTLTSFDKATAHYNSYIPKTEAEVMGLESAPAISAPTAYASTQNILVNGVPVEFQAYALKDAAGNLTNYVKLRDVASVLNGTAVQFNVGWDGAVNVETGKGYAPNGSEMKTPFSGDRAYEPAAAPTNVNGAPAALEAIVLKDDAGGAYTYYKLRDLGAALGFTVDWSAEQGIFIETK